MVCFYYFFECYVDYFDFECIEVFKFVIEVCGIFIFF